VTAAIISKLEHFMKKLTCQDLGGPCDTEFTGESFEEIGKKSREHVMEQMQAGDAAHLSAANKMRNATPEEQKGMMAEFKRKFNVAPNI
jgi:predicted small metal-binding protein